MGVDGWSLIPLVVGAATVRNRKRKNTKSKRGRVSVKCDDFFLFWDSIDFNDFNYSALAVATLPVSEIIWYTHFPNHAIITDRSSYKNFCY